MPSIIPPDQLPTRADFQRLERQIAEIKATLERFAHDQQIQFTRIAQLQADIDLIRAAWTQIQSPDASPPYAGRERRTGAAKRR